MVTTRTLRRRTLLGAISAATVGTAIGTTIADEQTEEYPPTAGGRYTDGRIQTYPCGAGKPVGCHDDGTCDWAPSSITFQNCSDCPRDVHFEASGKVSLERYMPMADTERLESTIALTVQGGQRVTVFFTGSVTHLSSEHADINIAISQRSAGYAASSGCIQPTEPETETAPPARVEQKPRGQPIEHRHEHYHEHYHEHRVTIEDERDDDRYDEHDTGGESHRDAYYREDGSFDRRTCQEEATTYEEYESCRDHCVPDC